jgi:TolB-like protein
MAAPGAGLRRWVRRLAWIVPGAIVVAGAAWGGARLLGKKSGAAADTSDTVDPRHIAVLYFDDRSPDKSLGYLTDGLTEALIHELSAVSALQVVSRNGVALYRHLNVGTDSIRRALKVGTIVDGTLAPAGDSLRLTVSMVDATSGAELETAALTVPRAHAMTLEDSLPAQVAFLLRRHLGQEIERHATRAETGNEHAWELMQQGKEVALLIDTALAAGDTARAARTLGRADSMFAGAAAADRKWTAPIVERGWLAWSERHIAGFDKGPADRWTRAGLGFAEDALRLRADDPEALHLRGTMRYARWFLNLDPAPLTPDKLLLAAEGDLRAGSVDANPNRANALALLSQLLAARSQVVDAKLTAMQAYEVDPYQSQAEDVLTRLFLTSLDLEDVAESNKWCREGFRRFPNSPQFTECQILVYALKGQKPDVPTLWRLLDQNVAQYSPGDREYRRRRGELFVAMALANAGMKDSARAVALRARAGAGADIDPTRDLIYTEILFRSMAGDRDEAIRLLKLYLVTNPQGKANIAADSTWWLRELRADPEFRQIVGLSK